jgi:potassium efflux system protein
VSRTLGRIAAQRLDVKAGAAAAIESLTFYALLVAVVLFALRTVNFPLTAFTILGGAFAIGIGFGSQNVTNNFISGLILMLEQPIRAGDLVEVEGTYGTIEQIGARSTRIRSADNTHIIVPNSFFLQNSVVNWTLSDDIGRTKVTVGVIYGSPTRTVERLLRQVLHEHPEILTTHEPRIIFADFGDNALIFDAYFWIRARSMIERRHIESDVRYRIDDVFREAGLVIAFPQRDVHLDSARPIDVRLCPPRPEDVPRG